MRAIWRGFLRLFFHLLYYDLAWSYDAVAWLVSLGQWRAWGRTTMDHLRGTRILELGHGPGHLLAALERQAFSPVGLDLSPQMGRQAMLRLRGAGLSVPLVRARAQALPFRARCLDAVVATFPTGYILDPRALEEVTRAVVPGGRLVVALGARFKGEGLVAAFFTWLYQVTGQSEPSPETFVRWLEEMGLSASLVREQVGRTTVHLIVAEKR